MKTVHALFSLIVMLGCISVCGIVDVATGQVDASQPSQTVQRIMQTALGRCYTNINGVSRISYAPPTDKEIDEVKALGQQAITPLAAYLDLEPKDGLSQLTAVKFLIAVGGPLSFNALIRAVAQDQWEVTRVQALSGLFEASKERAKAYVQAALNDDSQLVRQRARDLWKYYE